MPDATQPRKPRGKKDCDEQLLLALAAGAGASQAAQQAGVSERTVRRRLEENAFRQRIAAMRSELVSRAVGRLSALGALSVDTLEGLLSSQNENVRLGAARAALDFMFKGVEQDVLAKELEELRRLVEELADGKGPAQSDAPAQESDGSGTDRSASAGADSAAASAS
jgi:hypothetical protein